MSKVPLGGKFKHECVANLPLSTSTKKIENRLIFGEVMDQTLLSCFFYSRCRTVMRPLAGVTQRFHLPPPSESTHSPMVMNYLELDHDVLFNSIHNILQCIYYYSAAVQFRSGWPSVLSRLSGSYCFSDAIYLV